MVDRRLKLLLDATDAIDLARSFLGGASLEEYSQSPLIRAGVERQLEILGEACMRLAKLESTLFDRIPACRSAIGLRNRIIHGYDALDDNLIRETVLAALPPLRMALHAWLTELDPQA
ncbi:MAG: DUF86 domain-containing protein [Burkholderiales bacterium]|nr:DUF86 domain-containing protein [Burkholderiales bacterium]